MCSSPFSKSIGQPSSSPFAPGLSITNGVEPACPCEAHSGNRCWYIDANADSVGAVGTINHPFNCFTNVVGYLDTISSYHQGLLHGGDFLYIKGTFKGSLNINGMRNQNIAMYRANQGDSGNPTVIKTWPGNARAVFDGEFLMSDMLYITNALGVKIQNVEVTRCNTRGIYIAENVKFADVNNVVVHHCQGDGISGLGGGIMFVLTSGTHNFSLHNSLFYCNMQNLIGGNNNIGGVSILSESTATANSIINIYNNVIHGEVNGIRHKHSGNMYMNAFNNLIYNCSQGFLLRAYKMNAIYNNILLNDTLAFGCDAENQQGDFTANIYNNTIINSLHCLNTGSGSGRGNYKRTIAFYNNIYYSPASSNVLSLGRWSNEVFDIAGWSSSFNDFYCIDSSVFLYYPPNLSKSPLDAMVYLNDNTSKFFDPGFQNVNMFALSISDSSKCRNFDKFKKDIGALPFGTEFTVDTNLYY